MKELKLNFKNDQVLLVKGPASVKVINGKVNCLANLVSSIVVVRKGKVLPFECEGESCIVNVSVLDENQIEIQNTNYGTYIWRNEIEKMLAKLGKEYKKILIIGSTDSGKSTLSVYLLNLALQQGLKVGLIDADVGQSDLTPPAFIGCKRFTRKIYDLRDEKADFIVPVGAIDSYHFNNLIIEAIKKGINFLQGVDLVIINTDGFVADKGIENKIQMIKEISPELIIALNQDESIEKIIESFKEQSLILKRSRIIRNRDIRAERRESQYQRFLVDSRKVGYDIREIKFGFLGEIYSETVIEKDFIVKYSQNGSSLRLFQSKYNLLVIDQSKKEVFISYETLRNMFIGLEENGYIKSFGVIDLLYDNKIRILTNFQGKLEAIWLTLVKITNEGEQKISFRFI